MLVVMLCSLKVRSFAGALLLLVLVHMVSWGQNLRSGSLAAASEPSVPTFTVETRLGHSAVARGSSIEIAVLVTIPDGWHVNAHTPSESYLIGTSLDLQPVDGFIVTNLQYPPARQLKLGFEDKPLNVYDGTFPIFLSVRVSDKIAPAQYTLQGTVRLQACNDDVCLPPTNLNVAIPITVASDGAEIVRGNDELFAAYASAATTNDGHDSELAAMFEQRGVLVTFAAIFLIGLALNLTPCVYPMLSVTVSIFGRQDTAVPSTSPKTSTSVSFFKAIAYVLGIATMYSVLGISAALSGGLFGSWLQSKWVLGGIGVLLFALALSMFGVYQLRAPYRLMDKLNKVQTVNYVGLFFSGLVVGIFAAPCVGPPVIGLLTLVASKGDPLFGFWAFFTLSIGLGLPYLILGTFSGMLERIPRSGAWLVWVERIFGVVLIGAALFYASLAFAPKLTPYVVPIVLVAGGLYLGFFERSGTEKISVRNLKWAFGIVAIAFGLWIGKGLQATGISWEPYTEESLLNAQASGKPVILDFYADWCIPCIELDRRTFTNPDVISATRGLARLKVDLTHFDSPEAERVRKRFNIAGVPTVVFLDNTGSEVKQARVVGFLPSNEFIERVRLVEPSDS
jgi:thiol:disulfide interchange protein DsbD